MRVYKFLPKRFAIQALQRRRLKVARISELNDPFELLPFDLSDRVHHLSVTETIRYLNGRSGVVCFSRSWNSPVMWAHYAEQHQGLCLGFDIDEHLTRPIVYSADRMPFPDFAALDDRLRAEAIDRMLYTKFEDWRYEQEIRTAVHLDADTAENGLFFVEWGEQLRLAEVVVGLQSTTCRRELDAALMGYPHPVPFIKARSSRTAFEVVADEHGLRNHDDATLFLRRDGVLHPVEFVARRNVPEYRWRKCY